MMRHGATRFRRPIAVVFAILATSSIVVGTFNVAIAAGTDDPASVSTDASTAETPGSVAETAPPPEETTTTTSSTTTTTAPPDTTTDTPATSPLPASECAATGHETVATDKDDYKPEQTVQITGAGYAPGCPVTVRVTRPNGSVVKGDGTFTPGSDTVTTSADGHLAYAYILDGILGTYVVDVLDADGAVLASATFTDAITFSVSWEKRSNSGGGLVQGATFTVGGATGPFACTGDSTNPVTVVDDGTNDTDATDGQTTLANVCPGTYTVTETIAPAGFLVDPDPTRSVTVTNANLVIGGSGAQDCPDAAPSTDGDLTSDFCNPTVTGSIAWEKRREPGAGLQSGATFTVGGATGPFACSGITTNPITVVDNGTNDSDGTGGQLLVNGVCAGTYTVTETVAPIGSALEGDTTRTVVVAASAEVIGTQGNASGTCPDSNDASDTDEDDFCNPEVFNVTWEKRAEPGSGSGPLIGFATFTMTGSTTGPRACRGDSTNPITVVDDGSNDTTTTDGRIVVENVCPGTYTITETIAPTGYTVDPDATRSITVTSADINIGGSTSANDCHDTTPDTDGDLTSDFCDPPISGAIAWEKRSEPAGALQGGATFTVGGTSGPFACSNDATNPVTVVDNGTNDSNNTSGQLLLSAVCPGTYTVTETVSPAEYQKDPDATRVVTVASSTVTIGTQGTLDDCHDTVPATDGDLTSDFCNPQLFRVSWEKRQEPNGQSLAGATFTVDGASGPFSCTGDSTNPATVVDNGTNDSDNTTGQLELRNACPGTYTVTETVPPSGFALDPDATRSVTVSNANVVIGTQGSAQDCTDPNPSSDGDLTSDFCDPVTYRISWEKREETGSGNGGLLAGATFTVSGSPFACRGDSTNPVTVVDGGTNDSDPGNGQLQLNNVCNGTYTVTETVAPSGYSLDPDATRQVTVSNANAVIGTQGSAQDCHDAAPADDDAVVGGSDFCDPTIGSRTIQWEKRAHSNGNLVGGATFTVGGTLGPFACTGDSTNPVTVVDNGPNDADPSNGQFKVTGACTGAFTVTETVAPSGLQLDPDPTRAVDTTNASVIIGTQGSAQDCTDPEPANDDAVAGGSDFCDPTFPILQWEKRSNATGDLVGGATFTVLGATGGPLACRGTSTNPLTVVDDGTHDSDATHGQLELVDVCPGDYTITETVPPSGYTKDPDATRSVTVGTSDVVVGTQGTADDCADPEPSVDGDLTSDFCNPKLFKISWEKRYEPTGDFLTGATFTVGGVTGPFACAGDPTNPVTVVDQGLNDADGNGGNIALANVCPGTYTVTETLPATHYAIDPDPTRTVTVTDADVVVGTMGLQEDCGPDPEPAVDTDGSDFCDPETWDILWEKREDDGFGFGPFAGGATFTVEGVSPTGAPRACRNDFTNPVTIVDQGAEDQDSAQGQIRLNNVCAGTYLITETVPPPGLALDPDPTREVTIAVDGPNVSIGTQGRSDDCTDPDPAVDEEEDPATVGSGSDFCDPRIADRTIEWEKRREPSGSLLGGATFTVGGVTGPFACTGDPTNPVTVADDGPLDANSNDGKIKLVNVCPGVYTITETAVPSGFAFEPDPTRTVDVTAGDAVIGTQGTEDDCTDPEPADDDAVVGGSDFCDPATFRLSWEKRRQLNGNLLGGATFTISGVSPTVGPFACRGDSTDPVTVADNGPLDIDANDGQVRVENICAGTYTVTETVPPPGYSLDPDATRVITVTGSISGDENPIGEMHHPSGSCPDSTPADAETDDFCNAPSTLFDVEWEKRDQADGALLGGATFEINGTDGPFACAGDATKPVTVVDNGSNDSDSDAGQVRVIGVCPGSYTVTETVQPSGYAVEPDPTRAVTVGSANEVIGTQAVADECPDSPTSASDSDDADFCNTRYEALVTTQVHDASHTDVTNTMVPAGSMVHDEATVTGSGPIPSGTVDFQFFTTGDCTGDSSTESDVALIGGVGKAESSSTAPLTAGAYSYLAHYDGDANYAPSDGICEPFSVDKYRSSVSTQVHDTSHIDVTGSSVPAGSVVHDEATVTGSGPAIAGTVDFDFFTTGDCTGDKTTESDVAVVSGVGKAESSASAPLAPGSYSYSAHYDGDASYAPSDGICEPFSVDKYSSSVTTQVHDTSHTDVTNTAVPAESVVHDQATVTGSGPEPTGTVDFEFFTNDTCTEPVDSTEADVAMSSAVAESSATAALAPGKYSYLAHYDGDASYAPSDGLCEPFSVDKYSSSVTTEVHDASHADVTNTAVPAGSVVHDQATVTGSGPAVTGSVDFDFFLNGDCTGQPDSTESNVALTGGVGESTPTAALGTGAYSYLAHYSGDDSYAGDDGECEPFSVAGTKAVPSVATQVHDASHTDVTNTAVPAGSVVHDQATVTGTGNGPTPTGTVDFLFFLNGDCTAPTAGTESNVALTGGVTESSSSAPLAVGAYSYRAHYDGDANYAEVLGACEPFSVVEVGGATGTIRVEKVTLPDPDATGPFPITVTGAADPALPADVSLPQGGTGQSIVVKAGAGYGASENVPAGWVLQSTTCTSSNASHTDIDHTSFSVAVGELVTCVFVNDPAAEVLGSSVTRGTLPFTGSDLLPALPVAVVLITIGGAFVVVTRRRRRLEV